MAQRGRPRKESEIDLDKVELMGQFKATYETMAEYFNTSVRTIERYMSYDEDDLSTMTDFCRSYKKGFSSMKMKISEAQIKSATEDRNATMLIWLGKQHLGQSDKKEIEHSGEVKQQIFRIGDTEIEL